MSSARDAEQVIARYDEIVRRNMSEDWDTIAAVATCNDGIMGAWGEVLDVAREMGFADDDGYYIPVELDDALGIAFKRYQSRLLEEVTQR